MQVKKNLVEQLQPDVYYQSFKYSLLFIKNDARLHRITVTGVKFYPHLNKSKEIVNNVLLHQHPIISSNESHPVTINMRQITIYVSKCAAQHRQPHILLPEEVPLPSRGANTGIASSKFQMSAQHELLFCTGTG